MNDISAITGGEEILVTLRDGNAEKVKVLALSIEKMVPLLEAAADDLKQIEIYTGKDSEWAKGMTLESQVAVIEKGEELNGDFFERWLMVRAKKMQRFSRARPAVEAASNGADASRPLPSSSPRPRSSAA